jgi:hypothetical protein
VTIVKKCAIIILTCIDLSHDLLDTGGNRTRQKRKEVCSHGKEEKKGRQEDGQAKDHQEAKGGEAPTLNKSPASGAFIF